jgi:hypothetical protein
MTQCGALSNKFEDLIVVASRRERTRDGRDRRVQLPDARRVYERARVCRELLRLVTIRAPAFALDAGESRFLGDFSRLVRLQLPPFALSKNAQLRETRGTGS